MNTIPTIAAGFPSLCAAAWIGQGRAFERRFPDASATGAPRCYHPFGHRARQHTGSRFARKFKTLRPEFAALQKHMEARQQRLEAGGVE